MATSEDQTEVFERLEKDAREAGDEVLENACRIARQALSENSEAS